MLIPMQVFHAVQHMDLVQLDVALKANGYPTGASDLTSSRFLGMNTDGKFVYEVTYGTRQSSSTGNIYVEICRIKGTDTFEFLADY